MSSSGGQDDLGAAPAQHFLTTHWSMVLAAGRSDSTHARSSLEKLCRVYWPPLYSFVRRKGHDAHEAQDLTQGFFAQLLEHDYLKAVDRNKGKFRSFLLASLKHYMANEWDRAHAQKRGGNQVVFSIDEQDAEHRYSVEPAHDLTPEKLYERRWALTLLDAVMLRLRNEYASAGKQALLDELKETLTGEKRSESYAEIGGRLGLSEGAVKVAVHRLRQRYREVLRAEIAETVSSPDEIEEEIRSLFSALSS